MVYNNKNEIGIKGIKFSKINLIVIILSFVLCAFFVFNTISIEHEYETMVQAGEDCLECRNNAQLAKDGSYYLTEQVHLFVATGDKQFADNYFTEANVTKRRDNAINNLKNINNNVGAYNSLVAAVKSSNELMETEIYAIRLIAEVKGYDISSFDKRVAECELSEEDKNKTPEEKTELANSLVFGTDYLNYRNDIDNKVKTSVENAYNSADQIKSNSMKKLFRNILGQFIFIVLVFLLNGCYSLFISRYIVKPLRNYVECVETGKTFDSSGVYEFKHLAETYNRFFKSNLENEERLKYKANHDFMTGLFNKGAFETIAAEYTGKAISIAIILMDIDNFKEINDTYGHTVGDEIIKNVGKLLIHRFRPADFIARFGGDEFIVIMAGVTEEFKENISDKIKSINNELNSPDSRMPAVSLSVGVAFSEYGYSEALLNNADKALYYTKKNGRGDCTFNDIVYRKRK